VPAQPLHCDDLDAARDAIESMLPTKQDRPPLILIAGPVASGKSTLAAMLANPIGVIIATDDYLPDYHTLPKERHDLPESADLARLTTNLQDLLDRRSTSVPTWSFHTHRRAGERLVHPADRVVCEGLHALHHHIDVAADAAVFVTAPAAVRWERWRVIAERGERGWNVAETRDFFDRVAEPTFQRHADAYRARANIIVTNDTPYGAGG